MDAFEIIKGRGDVREFSAQDISPEIKSEILQAARLTGTGMNSQHWRFIIVEEKDNLKKLAADSTSGSWIEGAKFAVVVLTNPKYGFHKIDAGRVLQNMQIAAWNKGIDSCLFTGIREDNLRRDFAIPNNLHASVIIGFGYPIKKQKAIRKNRLPIHELVYYEKYGQS